jgi:hypothetical protein
MWALRISRRRMNAAWDCSAAVYPWRIMYNNTPAYDQKRGIFFFRRSVGVAGVAYRCRQTLREKPWP